MSTNQPSDSESGEMNLDHLEALPSLPRAHKLVGRNLDSLECLYSETQMREYAHVARRAALANQPAPTVPAASMVAKLARVSKWIDKFPVPTDGATAMMCLIRDVQEALAHQPAQEQAKTLIGALNK